MAVCFKISSYSAEHDLNDLNTGLRNVEMLKDSLVIQWRIHIVDSGHEIF